MSETTTTVSFHLEWREEGEHEWHYYWDHKPREHPTIDAAAEVRDQALRRRQERREESSRPGWADLHFRIVKRTTTVETEVVGPCDHCGFPVMEHQGKWMHERLYGEPGCHGRATVNGQRHVDAVTNT